VRHGPLIFLGALAAVLASWLLTVVAPHFQIGSQELIPIENAGIHYPLDRQGDAKQGAEVYRAQGCVYCHTQQVVQEPFRSVITLADADTNAVAVAGALRKVRRDLDASAALRLVQNAPQDIFLAARAPEVLDVTKLLTNAGARIDTRPANLGPDLRRGWGNRRTVSRDYLRDQPVMLGQVRFGPDLANVGARLPDAAYLLRKLYNARIDMPGSTMPRYTYLFEERTLRPGQAPSLDALPLPDRFAPPAGREIVPTLEARQLVAYLLSLKSEQVFYEVFPPPRPAKTNTLAVTTAATNAPTAGTNPPVAAGTPPAGATNAPTQP
jgi:cbb3-type cytochrome oxidase cytochrome c subunit